MNHNFPLCFEITPKRITQDNTYQSEIRKEILQSQQQVMRSLTRLASNFTFSLRYYYNPDQNPKIKSYLLLNHPPESQTKEISEQVFSLLTKGKLSDFFTLTPQTEFSQYQKLNWVNFIGEILKQEEFIEPQNYYLPYFFEANQANDMSAVYDVINRSDKKLILEITVQTYQNSDEKQLWVNAINQMVTQLDTVNSNSTSNKDNLLSTTLALYQKYQQLYPTGDLFKYSIKALAENLGGASVVLNTLIEHATKENHHGKQCQIVLVNKDKPGFSESLQATENVDISTAIEWSGWQKKFSEMVIKEVIKPKKIGVDRFKDNPFSKSSILSPPKALNPAQNQNQPTEYDAVLGGSPLAKFSSPPPSRIIDLKPLHRLATSQEISGFFRIAVPKLTADTSLEETTKTISEEFTNGFNIEYAIAKYKHLIDEDNYFVGIDQYGKPYVSNWKKIPHRIIAGETGSGKTNFIMSVIYQFLYANPHREIYIADFQAGLHYQFIVAKQPTVKIVTKLEDCANLMGKLWHEHEARRQQMLDYGVRSLAKLEEKAGIKKPRSILIIDEAFYIKNAEREVKKVIETHLNSLAAQSRVTGIHIIYCSHTPTSEVIDTQTSNNMGEKVIFRINSRTDSMRLIGEDTALNLPVEPKGRAMYKGLDGIPKVVATPEVPDDIWE